MSESKAKSFRSTCFREMLGVWRIPGSPIREMVSGKAIFRQPSFNNTSERIQ